MNGSGRVRVLPGSWITFSAVGLALVWLSGCASFRHHPAHRQGGSFEFALIGDVPYNAEQTTNLFPNMIAELNHARLAFVVHDGDIKAGASRCTDEIFEERREQFATFHHPLIYVFGDNEWSDCGKMTNGFDPVERLAKLRAMFTQGDESLGRKKLKLERQSDDPQFNLYRENVRWVKGGVQFVGLNVPGASNNHGQPEFAARNAANIAMIQESFDLARSHEHRALMIIIQANPFPELGSTNKVHAGFKGMLAVLERETLAWDKPVVLVHGDSHYFRIDKPLAGARSGRRIENFTRVETFGNPDVHWLRVTVDPGDPNVFTFRPQMIRSNFVQHLKTPTTK